MTEQETQELATFALRLKQVWGPEKVTFCAFGQRGLLNWAARVQENVFIAINLYRDGSEFHCFCKDGASLYVDYDGKGGACLCVDHYGKFEVRGRDSNMGDQFAAKWMPFFRRNAWLSGLSIEATAHEKAEWMQSFSHEELKAWNLKF